MGWKKWSTTKRGLIIGFVVGIIISLQLIYGGVIHILKNIDQYECGLMESVKCTIDQIPTQIGLILFLMGIPTILLLLFIGAIIGYSIKNKSVLFGWIIGALVFLVIGFVSRSSPLFLHPLGFILVAIFGLFLGAFLGWIIGKIKK